MSWTVNRSIPGSGKIFFQFSEVSRPAQHFAQLVLVGLWGLPLTSINRRIQDLVVLDLNPLPLQYTCKRVEEQHFLFFILFIYFLWSLKRKSVFIPQTYEGFIFKKCFTSVVIKKNGLVRSLLLVHIHGALCTRHGSLRFSIHCDMLVLCPVVGDIGYVRHL